MSKKVFIFTIMILLLVMTVLAGCSNSSNTSTSTQPQNEGTSQGSNNSNVGTSQDSNKASQENDNYPNEQPITIVIPFAAGVAGDMFTRTFAKALENYVEQPIVPLNKEGGSGIIGVSYTLAQANDGYTIVYHSSTMPYTIAAGDTDFGAEDLVAISTINADYQVLAVRKESPFQTFEDFVNFAKENPGKLNISGSGTRGTNHIFAQKVLEGAGIEAVYVPYSGGSQSLTAALGGEVDALAGSSSVVNQYVDTGDIRILAVTGNERAANRPEIPTFKELGLTNIGDEFIWRGLFASSKVPQEKLDKLSEIFAQVIEDPIWREYMENQGQMDFYKNAADATEFLYEFIDDSKAIFETLQ